MVKTITYVFLDGRRTRINDQSYSDDFFYGYRHFKANEESYDVHLLEMSETKKTFFTPFWSFVDYFLRKLSKCSFFLKNMMTLENYKRLLHTDVLVLTTDRIGFSSLPFLFLLKIKKKKIIMFAMGMTKIDFEYKIIEYANLFFTKLLISTCIKVLFLSSNEHQVAKLKFSKYESKLQFVPFCIDTDFWSAENSINKDGSLLFIGNDGKRDYELVESISNELVDFKPVLISRRINQSNLNDEVQLIRGSWKADVISDELLKNYYTNSLLVFLPLTESLQPSGQSVALQAMSMGIPVVITETKGFWDSEKLIDQEHIFLVNYKTKEQWSKFIKDLLENRKLLKTISKNARKVVKEHYDHKILHKALEELF